MIDGICVTWGVDDGQIGTVLVLNLDNNLLGPKLAFTGETLIFVLNVFLQGDQAIWRHQHTCVSCFLEGWCRGELLKYRVTAVALLIPPPPHLQLLQCHVLLPELFSHEIAPRLHALGVVFHVECDGPPGLGAATDVVELEPHQRLNESCTVTDNGVGHILRKRNIKGSAA
jgi:hypothetical protein